MPKLFWAVILLFTVASVHGLLKAQTASPQKQRVVPSSEDLLSPSELQGKVGLVRGVLEHVDPIHDQLLIHAFGGGDVRISFDQRTELASAGAVTRLEGVPKGTVLSIDTVMESGKLFARSVRIGSYHALELNGQIVRYDPTRSALTLRDPMSPDVTVLHLSPETTIVGVSRPGSREDLLPGALARVWASSPQRIATQIEILAKPGSLFTFAGRITSVDLRSRTLSLSNDTDDSLRELAFGPLDSASLALLHEGADVSIQAEFDGHSYNVRSVALVPNTAPQQ